MLNQEIGSTLQYAKNVDPRSDVLADRRAALKKQYYIDARLRQIVEQSLRVLGEDARDMSAQSLRQALVDLSGKYNGDESQRFAHYCRALHLMSKQQFRAALTAFEQVLLGRANSDLEPIRRIALELHSVCLEELEFDDHAMEQFTQLLHRKFEETRAYGGPDDVAQMLGLGGVSAPMSL